ncbi:MULTISPECIES: aminopeptidase P family protein [Pseudomonas]|uniref:aminopeptidase P family protein n=1 Tax=Pseudomonas TaxID=286 RepID=UPI000539B913|nr:MULTISPECIES: aminopeptidase P family protein [Pseudomonas]PRA42465.1 aminopeptidase P family protein [Pseudomonas sp. MYb115]WSO26669.1 aminopeptidase P family protein [Pseudomonas fluorescens]
MGRCDWVRKLMSARRYDAFLLPRSDAYLNEDLAPADEALHWLSGFTGSVGLAALTQKGAALLVDGRYTEQARHECPRFETLMLDDSSLFDWLRGQLPAGATIACDARLHSIDECARWQALATQSDFNWHASADNPVYQSWRNRPDAPNSPVLAWALEYAGMTAQAKLDQLTASVRGAQCDALWLPAPDMLAWLLNVRGGDIAIAPLPFSNGLLYADGRLDWFIDAERLQLPEEWLPATVSVRAPRRLEQCIAELQGQRVWIDRRMCTAAVYRQFESAACVLHEAPNPLLLQRACKQPAELCGSREAHRIDGLALCRFLYEFHCRCERFIGQSELSIVESLEGWRSRHPDYRGVSFETIAATGANGAQPHYLPKPGQAAKLRRGELLLIDSGGQYTQGTTDVTRVLACSPPSAWQRELYTTVLRAHIALASCLFPMGTSGQQLDSVARQVMWREGLDYGHGTGHGVGSYLHVHEGPHRIAPHASAVPLQAGMVTSIEPGVYLPGELGIRIENLYEVIEVEAHPGFLGFRVLTLAPFANELIDRERLSPAEACWLDEYHRTVQAALIDALEPDVGAWLLCQTQPNNLQFQGQ